MEFHHTAQTNIPCWTFMPGFELMVSHEHLGWGYWCWRYKIANPEGTSVIRVTRRRKEDRQNVQLNRGIHTELSLTSLLTYLADLFIRISTKLIGGLCYIIDHYWRKSTCFVCLPATVLCLAPSGVCSIRYLLHVRWDHSVAHLSVATPCSILVPHKTNTRRLSVHKYRLTSEHGLSLLGHRQRTLHMLHIASLTIMLSDQRCWDMVMWLVL